MVGGITYCMLNIFNVLSCKQHSMSNGSDGCSNDGFGVKCIIESGAQKTPISCCLDVPPTFFATTCRFFRLLKRFQHILGEWRKKDMGNSVPLCLVEFFQPKLAAGAVNDPFSMIEIG